jgi:hypothetical protein
VEWLVAQRLTGRALAGFERPRRCIVAPTRRRGPAMQPGRKRSAALNHLPQGILQQTGSPMVLTVSKTSIVAVWRFAARRPAG